MSTAYPHAAGVALVAVLSVVIAGCSTPRAKPDATIDPEALWQSASRRHDATVASIQELAQLESDYGAIIRLTRDGGLRGRAYLKLAELSEAMGNHEETRRHLEQALRCGMAPTNQRVGLLKFGFVLDQRLNDYAAARAAYQQLINEYPESEEAALAMLRLKYVSERNGIHGN